MRAAKSFSALGKRHDKPFSMSAHNAINVNVLGPSLSSLSGCPRLSESIKNEGRVTQTDVYVINVNFSHQWP